MSSYLGTIAVSSGQKTRFEATNQGVKAILIGNTSGLTCTIVMESGGVSKTLYPGVLDWFAVRPGFSGNILINPQAVLNNVSSWPSNALIFDAIGLMDTESSAMYPLQLSVPAVNSTASGKPLFSSTVGFGVTATKHQVLNVFNPPTSGVTYTFYSVRAFTSSSTAGTRAFIQYTQGADNNLSTPVQAVSHAGTPNPPVSTAHVTAWDSNALLTGTDIEEYDTETNVTVDFLTFPDSYTLYPGGNLWVDMDDASSTGNVVRLTMKWSEDIVVAPAGGLPMTIPATSVQQDGLPVGPIVEATPQGSGQTVLITTDGKLVIASNESVGGTLAVTGKSTLGVVEATGAVTADSTLTVTGDATLNGAGTGLTVANAISTDGGKITSNGTGNLSMLKALFTIGSLTRISIFSGSASTVSAAFNHGLGVVPDVILLQQQGGSSTTRTIAYDPATMTTTQVSIIANASFNFIGLAIKS